MVERQVSPSWEQPGGSTTRVSIGLRSDGSAQTTSTKAFAQLASEGSVPSRKLKVTMSSDTKNTQATQLETQSDWNREASEGVSVASFASLPKAGGPTPPEQKAGITSIAGAIKGARTSFINKARLSRARTPGSEEDNTSWGLFKSELSTTPDKLSVNLDRSAWRSEEIDNTVKERLYRRSCCECLLLIPLFVVYMVLQWSHLSLAPAYRIERVLRFEFMKKRFGNYSYTVANVHDAALFWEWFEVMLSETVVVQHDELGHALPKSDWGYVNGFNKIIGGMRLMQDRGEEIPCEGDPTELCYNLHTDTSPFGYPPCSSETERTTEGSHCYMPSRYTGAVNIEANEGFTYDTVTGHFEMWLDTLEPRHLLQLRTQYLEDRHWIDKQTRHVKIEMLLQNDQYEPLLSEVIFDFTFDRTGYIHEAATIDTLPANPYAADSFTKIGLGSLYVLLNIALVYMFLRDLRSNWRELGRCFVALKWTLSAHAVEIVSVGIMTAQVSLWCVYIPHTLGILGRIEDLERPGEVATHTNEDEALWQDFHQEITSIEDGTHHSISVMRWLRELSAAALLCILLRHFKAWEGIPAFAAVTRTLSISAVRLGAVLLSACTMVALFAGAAMLNYGSQLEEFHSVSRALQETAIIAMTGEPSAYDKMSAVDPIFATAWFWSLIAVMFMVVLNMILGILVDAASAAGRDAPIGLQEQLVFTLQSYGHEVKDRFSNLSNFASSSWGMQSFVGSEGHSLDLEDPTSSRRCQASDSDDADVDMNAHNARLRYLQGVRDSGSSSPADNSRPESPAVYPGQT